MWTEPDRGTVFGTTTFEGTISTGDFDQSLTFVAHAADDCRLVIDPLTVTAETYFALINSMGRPGGHAESITLEGVSEEGTKFSSSHMEICGWTSGTNGHEIRLMTGEASLTLPRNADEKVETVGVQLALRGFKSFRPKPVQAKLGKVTVQGATNQARSPDCVSGTIYVQWEDGEPKESWYKDAEALAEFIWKGLQFGHGGRLQVPLLQVYRPDEIVATFYYGSGRTAYLPAIHFLNQSEFVAALVARYEADEPFPEAVWQAVGWLNNHSSIDEVRYLTLMTAIETILHSLAPSAPSTLLPKGKFDAIGEHLIQALAEFDLSSEETAVLVSNIRQINRAPLSQKLKAVVHKYGLSSEVFDDDLIRRLNRQRISIVHQGRSLAGDNLWDCILYAREMIALIVFSELRYKGCYQSYAEGHEQRTMQ